MKNPRFALLSHILPPSPSGQAVVLYRILSGINEDKYYLIHSRSASQPEHIESEHFRLRSQYYALPAEALLSWPRRFRLSYIRNKVNLFLQIYMRAKNIATILRQESRTSALIACSGDFADIPAASLVGRMLDLPFYAYIFDDYVFQWTGSQRWIAKLIAPSIFKRSAGIIGPNEFICEEYGRRYGVKAALVHNPYAREELETEPCSQWPNETGRIKIIYTGAIYHANFDCFWNLIQTMRLLSEYPLELHIFTAQTREELESQGIWNEKIFVHSHIPYSTILQEQRKADILFLPLAFKSPIREVIRTSAPGKLGEYLMSGRLVLAHVPASSFVAYYFKRYQCGLLADENDPHQLAADIQNLITDPKAYRQMIHNARHQASFDFSPDRAQDQLLELLQMKQ
ncbi:MAG TPA: glycosyltransferase [Anaerolineales bacterium]|nr:glycosyltransferase [Anaerolineales bacterium]